MYKIRNGTFETNSSAVHSLVVDSSGLESSKLPTDNDGYIITKFGNFGAYDIGDTCFDQETKLSYIATECFYLNHWDTNIEDNYTWNKVCEAVCKYADANGVKVLKHIEPEINHQEIPEYDLKFCDEYNEESVINFIFNKYVGIKFSHD